MDYHGLLRDGVENRLSFLKLHNFPMCGANVKSKHVINADLREVEAVINLNSHAQSLDA
jgi:hypothetical protein